MGAVETKIAVKGTTTILMQYFSSLALKMCAQDRFSLCSL